MDLMAYSQIPDLDLIAKKNGIDCPRLRGYRLMKCESEISRSELNDMKKENEASICTMLCEADPFWTPSNTHVLSWWTGVLNDYYCPKDSPDASTCDRHIAWSRIHGWKRKRLKWEIKKQNKKIEKQMEMFNKYVGREDIMMIHSRIGGGNWKYYCDQVVHQPWFIEKVDDWWDSTYCDIYARIEVE